MSDVQPDLRTPQPLRMRLYAMMFLQYFIQGCYLPIISLYVKDALGFSGWEIGVLGSALAVGPLFAPFIIGQVVDRHLATEKVLAVCHLAGAGLMLLLYYQSSFTMVVILGTLYSTLYVPSLMLTNSLTFHHLTNRDREFPVIRLWGTIGFVVPAWLVELFFLRGLEGSELNQARGIVLLMAGIAGLVMGVYSLTLPHTPAIKQAGDEIAPRKALGLLRMRSLLVLVIATFIISIAHKFFFVVNSPFLRAVLDTGGVKEAWEQRISSIGQVFEVLVMAVLGAAIIRYGFKTTMLVGAAAYVLRCAIFGSVISLDAPFPVVMTLVCLGQALHGVCFGCFLAAGYMYVDRVSPIDVRGTMQNFYGTFVIGLGFFVGGFIAGGVTDAFTHSPGDETLRSQFGMESTAGMVEFSEGSTDDPTAKTQKILDWPGVWFSSAAIALIGLLVFLAAFPKDAGEGVDEPSASLQAARRSDQPSSNARAGDLNRPESDG